MEFWNILWSFGIFSPVLVHCIKVNLATLLHWCCHKPNCTPTLILHPKKVTQTKTPFHAFGLWFSSIVSKLKGSPRGIPNS
jgi:hypothetical protein